MEMEMDDKHLKILGEIHTFNETHDLIACKKDIVQATELSFYAVDKRLTELQNGGLIGVKVEHRIAKIELNSKGKKVISSSQISLDDYTKS